MHTTNFCNRSVDVVVYYPRTQKRRDGLCTVCLAPAEAELSRKVGGAMCSIECLQKLIDVNGCHITTEEGRKIVVPRCQFEGNHEFIIDKIV